MTPKAKAEAIAEILARYNREIAEIVREYDAEINAILKRIRLRQLREKIQKLRSTASQKMLLQERRILVARTIRGRAVWLSILRGKPHEQDRAES